MNEKTIIVYCSIVYHATPPFIWFEAAQKLAKLYPVIFIDELKLEKREISITNFLVHIKWIVTLLKFRISNNFLIWNFDFPLLHIVLFFYLWCMRLVGYQVVLITNVPENYPIFRFIPHSFSCFECTDKYYPDEFFQNKNRIKKFDKIFANTDLLFTEMKKITSQVHRISSGYSQNLTISEEQFPKIPKSIIFSGGISRRINYELLYKLALLLTDYHFFFVGEMYLNRYYIDPQKDDLYLNQWQKLLLLTNVHYLGAYSSNNSIKLLSFFEWGIIPYDIADTMNYYSHPIKFYEYLAKGLFVISTPIPAITEYKNHSNVFIAENVEKMAHIIRSQNVRVSSLKEQKQIQKILSAQSVEKKVKQISNYLCFSKKSQLA